MPTVELLFGPPGTGKTTAALRKVEEAMATGIPAERIAYVSFTRAAVAEARTRLGVSGEAGQHFRTIHSLGHRLCGYNRAQILRAEHLAQLGDQLGETFTVVTRWRAAQARREGLEGERDTPAPVVPSATQYATPGDVALYLYGMAQARGTSAEQEWRSWVHPDLPEAVPWSRVAHIVRAYAAFKQAQDLVDFTDMVREAQGTLDVDLLVVDEAQDCTLSQWELLRRVVPDTTRVVLAGDDDQAIYTWNGADPSMLLRQAGARTVLPHSYRLPRAVHAVAEGVVRRIGERVPKTYSPRDADGAVHHLAHAEQVDLRSGEWLCLARTRQQLRGLMAVARSQGVVFGVANTGAGRDDNLWWSWQAPPVQAAHIYTRLQRGHPVDREHVYALRAYVDPGLRAELEGRVLAMPATVQWDRVFPAGQPGPARDRPWWEALPGLPPRDVTYLRDLLRQGERLGVPGRVRILTIHGAKGLEAEQVLLHTGLTQRVVKGATRDPDNERRVQYVGVTRAREQLHLVTGMARHQYQF